MGENPDTQPGAEGHQQPVASSRLKRFLHFFTKSEWVNVFLTGVIAGTGIVGIVLVVQGGKDTARIRDAAEKQAKAATGFSESAQSINTGIGSAVDKLNSQAVAINRLASDTEKANSNVIEADRPWIGAYFAVSDFGPGKAPTYTVTFVNSGKRPARVVLSQTLAVPVDFKDSPQYRPYDTTPSVSIVVPNQLLVTSWKDDNPISENTWNSIKSGETPFRVYARVEYMDMRTNSRYWTHVCWRYTPTNPALNGGFSNCAEYNEAK